MVLPAPDENGQVALLRLVLAVPGSRSLKDKRRVVHMVRDRLRAGRNLSVAEVGHLEHHGLAVLIVAQVGHDARALRGAMDALLHLIQGWQGFLVQDAQLRIEPLGDEPAGRGPG